MTGGRHPTRSRASVTLSFRARILLIVMLVALVPLGLVGLWLSRSAARSGEALVEGRLDVALEATMGRVQGNWIRIRSDILSLTEDPELQRALATGVSVTGFEGPRLDRADPAIVSLVVRAADGVEVWSAQRPARPAEAGAARIAGGVLSVSQEIWHGLSDTRLGSADVGVRADGLLGSGDVPPEAAGTVIGLFASRTGASLSPTPFDPLLLEADRFRWGGESWLTTRRFMADPPLTVVVAAGLAPFTLPFEEAARDGMMLLLAVTFVGLALAVTLTHRLTESLVHLSEAADAVAGGELSRRIETQRGDEVGRVAEAFNAMTQSLETTLSELSRQQSLAAVGQFAASLAHEVRNPLTAIRVDLQRVEAGLDPQSPLREPHARALREIVRLDDTVARALRRTRSDAPSAGEAEIDVAEPIQAACDAAAPAFDDAAATLTLLLPESPLDVKGDRAGLEQLFLNLLQNAAQSLPPGGGASIDARIDSDTVVVTVSDNGVGIPADVVGRVFDPLFSTRPEGTGLGLTIVRRIAEAHGGEVTLKSEVGKGTQARVRLPRA